MNTLTDLLYRIQTDHAFYRHFLADPEDAIRTYDLTRRQREALLARDERLYRMLLRWATASSRTEQSERPATVLEAEDESPPDLALHPNLDESPDLHLEPNWPPTEAPPGGLSLSPQLPPTWIVTVGPLGGPGPEPTLGPGPRPEPQFPPSPQPTDQALSRSALEQLSLLRELVQQVKDTEPPNRIEAIMRLMERL
jgi:hypothetical protein